MMVNVRLFEGRLQDMIVDLAAAEERAVPPERFHELLVAEATLSRMWEERMREERMREALEHIYDLCWKPTSVGTPGDYTHIVENHEKARRIAETALAYHPVSEGGNE